VAAHHPGVLPRLHRVDGVGGDDLGETRPAMRIEVKALVGGNILVTGDDGTGSLETPDPERALLEVRERLMHFVAADLAARRDDVPIHLRPLRGYCPTCGLPAPDCPGVWL
jgi:hypothetical protein